MAMEFMRAMGQKFHRTDEIHLDCGCWVIGGWVLDTMEPGVGSLPCCLEHRMAAQRAVVRFNDPDTKKLYGKGDAGEVLAILLREEIAQ